MCRRLFDISELTSRPANRNGACRGELFTVFLVVRLGLNGDRTFWVFRLDFFGCHAIITIMINIVMYR